MFLADGVNVPFAAEVKKYVTKSYIATVGALTDPAMMEEIVSSGKADIVELARGLICDPDIPNKALDGREDEIVPCIRCLYCFSSAMAKGHFFCALNPETNRERTFARALPAPKKQKVLVAGGGIGGMQAALTAAKNGHAVVLCEKGSRLGGAVRCEENVPFKKTPQGIHRAAGAPAGTRRRRRAAEHRGHAGLRPVRRARTPSSRRSARRPSGRISPASAGPTF
jgi:hypothetical protein